MSQGQLIVCILPTFCISLPGSLPFHRNYKAKKSHVFLSIYATSLQVSNGVNKKSKTFKAQEIKKENNGRDNFRRIHSGSVRATVVTCYKPFLVQLSTESTYVTSNLNDHFAIVQI